MEGLLSPCSCQPMEPGVPQGWSLRSSSGLLCAERHLCLGRLSVYQQGSQSSVLLLPISWSSIFVMLPIPTHCRLPSVNLQIYLEKLLAAQCTNPKPWPWECKKKIQWQLCQYFRSITLQRLWSSGEQWAKAPTAVLFWMFRIRLTVYRYRPVTRLAVHANEKKQEQPPRCDSTVDLPPARQHSPPTSSRLKIPYLEASKTKALKR